MNKKQIKVAILAFSSVLMASMTTSAILADIGQHFSSVDPTIIPMVLTIPSLLGMVFSLVSGPLSLKVSKRSLVLGGLSFILAGGLLAFLLGTVNIYILLFSSVLIGIGQGINATMSMAIIADYFQGDECSSLMGLQSAFVNGGSMMMLLISGLLAGINWRFSYGIYLVFIPIIFIVAKNLPHDPPIQAAEGDETSKGKLNGTVYFICFIVLCFTTFMFVFSTNVSIFISGNGLGDATASGLANSLMSGVGALTGIVYGQLKKLLKNYLIPVAFVITSLGMLLVFAIGNLPSVFIAAACAGFGLSIIMPTAMFIVSSSVAPSMSATAIALANAASNIGMFISPLLINPMARAIGGNESIKFLVASIGLLIVSFIIIAKNAGSQKNKIIKTN